MTSSFTYTYYLLDKTPVKVTFDHGNPVKAETPDAAGNLTINNRLLSRVLLDEAHEAEKISEAEFQHALKG